MQIMESLDVFTDAYEDLLRVRERLEKIYESEKDSGNVIALSNELEAIEDDFTKVEGIFKGYLSGTNRSSVGHDMERLKEEVFKRQEEIRRIEQEIKQMYADCERHLKQSLRRQNPPMLKHLAALQFLFHK